MYIYGNALQEILSGAGTVDWHATYFVGTA